MDLPQKQTNVQARMLARMEASSLLTNVQRAAGSGPNFEAANKIRSNFKPMAQASVAPYLQKNPGADSVKEGELPDEIAAQFPKQLQEYLPEGQQSRLVRS